MKKIIAVSLALFFGSTLLYSQTAKFKYKAERVLMDSTMNTPLEPNVEKIVSYYKPEMEKLMMEVIGVSDSELRSHRPESLLSNFASDALYNYTKKKSAKKVDFSLTNFGGIRAALPKGNIKRYDVFSVFPFENYIVVIDLPGKSVRTLFESFAKNRVEAMSYNVELKIVGDQLSSALIDGKPLDDNQIYRVATIDFLLSGGDNVFALRDAISVEQIGMLIRDAILDSITEATRNGKIITSEITGRVKIVSE